MALTGDDLKGALGNIVGFQTLNAGTGAGISDFLPSLKNGGPSAIAPSVSPTLGQ
jgi:hypothetical protein